MFSTTLSRQPLLYRTVYKCQIYRELMFFNKKSREKR